MGYIRHDAIVVTTWQREDLTKAYQKAEELGLPISRIVESPLNGYASFLIAPDGSKEEWKDSEKGEEARQAWKEWARKEGGLFIDWVHVNYGGDEPDHLSIVDYGNKEEAASDED